VYLRLIDDLYRVPYIVDDGLVVAPGGVRNEDVVGEESLDELETNPQGSRT
jgi:hypothetical protein